MPQTDPLLTLQLIARESESSQVLHHSDNCFERVCEETTHFSSLHLFQRENVTT
jgi:hypothetical protein